VKVLIPSALHSYTGGARAEAEGQTLADVLADLDRRYPGIRFRMIDEQGRIRRHIRFFSGNTQVFNLGHPLPATEELIIVQALSGG
jgi:molybdopterin synthase sulfur carrier subunit